MAFQPINDDHAIQSAAIGIVLNKPISWSSVESIIKSPLDWRRELPAIELAQVLDVQINPQTGSPTNRLTRGVEFSHKRPDGTASWLLNVLGQEIKVATTLYTRWDPTWAKAGDILIGAAGHLAMLEKDKQIGVTAISLGVTDFFSTADSQPDFSELFAPNDRMPSAILRQRKLWHSYTGWFSERPTGNVLNQLNIDARTGTDETSNAGVSDDRIRILIQHNQFFRPQTPIPFDTSHEGELQDVMRSEIPLMHEANKSILKELLTPSMQARIKVNG
jgi:uncharacterized protein (TIGR04255 family)